MKILFGCSTCSQKKRRELESRYHINTGHAIQKYNLLLAKGFAANGAAVTVFSGLPINRGMTKKAVIREKDEQESGVRYHYITTLNASAAKRLMIFFGTLFGVLKTKKEAETFAVFDCLNIACAYGMALGCKIKGIPCAAIVTDLPDMEHDSRLLKRVNNRLFKKADAFILLTEQMNQRVNPRRKPHIVSEGHVDIEAPSPDRQHSYEETNGKKVVLYAGSLKRIYGIESLVQGFIRADIPEGELHIYGNGDFREELEALSQQYPAVKYKGVAENAEIVAQEQRASLLVNPRPTAPEYTKYSFPSKNMEYMVSGTPVLTTVLPGMPEEYRRCVYLLEDETPQGICEALHRVFALPYAERRKAGAAARNFVLKHKSNVAQAQKILQFFHEMNNR